MAAFRFAAVNSNINAQTVTNNNDKTFFPHIQQEVVMLILFNKKVMLKTLRTRDENLKYITYIYIYIHQSNKYIEFCLKLNSDVTCALKTRGKRYAHLTVHDDFFLGSQSAMSSNHIFIINQIYN